MNHATFPFRCNLHSTSIDSFRLKECDGKNEREYDSIYGPPSSWHRITSSIYNDRRRQWRKVLHGNQIKTGILIYYFDSGWLRCALVFVLECDELWWERWQTDFVSQQKYLNFCYWYRNGVSIIAISLSRFKCFFLAVTMLCVRKAIRANSREKKWCD